MRRLFALVACLATLGGLILYSQAGQAQDNRPCHDNSEHCMISAATTYLDALVSHGTTPVRLARDVRRTEQGGFVTEGAATLRQSLLTDENIILAKRAVRWFVDKPDHEAVAFYLLDIGTSIPPSPTSLGPTVHLSERFKVEDGLITQIEVVFTVGTKPCEGDAWPPTPGSSVCPPISA
jgi:hypothetical protein